MERHNLNLYTNQIHLHDWQTNVQSVLSTNLMLMENEAYRLEVQAAQIELLTMVATSNCPKLFPRHEPAPASQHRLVLLRCRSVLPPASGPMHSNIGQTITTCRYS